MASFSFSPSSSSSSSLASQIKYDVFISFRGTDIRRNFLSHLVKDLRQKGVDVYVDERLERGEEIWEELSKAIEESQISLIIFSKDYASSRWCLEELAKIIGCMERYEQIVIPIFYHVDPSHVRHQKGSYGISFDRHENKYDMMKVQNWRIASIKAANLSGYPYPSSDFRNEAELIEEIVSCLLKRLDDDTLQRDHFKSLVGIDKRIAAVELLLHKELIDVCIIGIWGMGGIGKTTIANVLFSKLYSEYRGCCFHANVKEGLEKYGMADFKRKLFSSLLDQKDLQFEGSPSVIRRLRRKKVLVLLDDVNSSKDLDLLIQGKDQFGPGSIIIVTSRDQQVLCKQADHIYKVPALSYSEALQLFSLKAFKQEHPEKDWIDISKRITQYAKGNPLALEVLGSLLYGLEMEEWESQLEKLEKMPCQDVQEVLKVTYQSLDRDERKIFLYLACFFGGGFIETIKSLLNKCGHFTSIGLRNLHNKSFITIQQNHVLMHDLIREMGQEIVREQSFDDPGERNHLWDPIEIYQVLRKKMGTKAIQSIKLDMSRMKELSLSPHVFEKMVNLKLLQFDGDDKQCTVHLPKGLESFPDELRLLHWVGYPAKSLPLPFSAENLVILNMRYSCVEKLWFGVLDLGNLKEINLAKSKQLVELPDLSKAVKLESIYLTGCSSLVEVHPSILSLENLVRLELSQCIKLRSVRSNVPTKSLSELNLGDCTSLADFSVISEKLYTLTLTSTSIETLPSSIGNLNKLKYLYMNECQGLKKLPDELSKLRHLLYLRLFDCRNLDISNLSILFDGLLSLEDLRLDNCYNLYELPENISMLSQLHDLSLSGSNIGFMPASFKQLPKLRQLELSDCKMLRCVSELPPSIQFLNVINCGSLQTIIDVPASLESLKTTNCHSLEAVTVITSMPDSSDVSYSSHEFQWLVFENCMELNEEAVSNIMEFTSFRIKRTIWEHLSYREGQDHFRDHNGSFHRRIDVCLPNSKVPDWFSYRTRQDSITIPVSVSQHIEFMGFICCIVLSNFDSNSNETYKLLQWGCEYCHEEESDGQGTRYHWDPMRNVELTSEHTLLWYDFCSYDHDKEASRGNNQCDTFKTNILVRFKVDTDRRRSDMVIKECGVHPMYLNSGEQWNLEEILGHFEKKSELESESELWESAESELWELSEDESLEQA